MRQLRNLNFLVIFSILFLINDTSGLKCWRCSSDAKNSQYCAETLDHSQIDDQQKRYSYGECAAKPPLETNIGDLIPKCKISLQLVNDVPTYTRSCYWESENAPTNSCAIQTLSPSYIRTIACSTCIEDGCNDKLPIGSVDEYNENNSADNQNNLNNSADNQNNLNNSAMFAVLSHTVFATFVLSIIIGY